MWSIPKGLNEENESCLQTATRELFEETSIDVSNLEIILIKELPPVRYKKQSKTLHSFLIVTKSDISHHTLKCTSLVENRFPEVDRYLWADYNMMEKYSHESQQENLPLIKELLKSL